MVSAAPVRLQVTDHDVTPVLRLGSALLQHPIRLADSRSHPEEYLEIAALDRNVARAPLLSLGRFRHGHQVSSRPSSASRIASTSLRTGPSDAACTERCRPR